MYFFQKKKNERKKACKCIENSQKADLCLLLLVYENDLYQYISLLALINIKQLTPKL